MSFPPWSAIDYVAMALTDPLLVLTFDADLEMRAWAVERLLADGVADAAQIEVDTRCLVGIQ